MREEAMQTSNMSLEVLGSRRRFWGGLTALPWCQFFTRFAVGALAAGTLMLTGRAAHAQEAPAGGSPPAPPAAPNEVAAAPGEAAAAHPATYVETEPRKGLLIGGGITFGLGYTFSLIGAGKHDDPASNWLFVPVAGPFVYLANYKCVGPGGQPCVDDWTTPMVFTMFGVLQSVGAVLVAGGFLFPSEKVVGGGRAAAARSDSRPLPWIVTPAIVGQSGLGVAAAGTLY
jgi:hypothetical protein